MNDKKAEQQSRRAGGAAPSDKFFAEVQNEIKDLGQSESVRAGEAADRGASACPCQ